MEGCRRTVVLGNPTLVVGVVNGMIIAYGIWVNTRATTVTQGPSGTGPRYWSGCHLR